MSSPDEAQPTPLPQDPTSFGTTPVAALEAPAPHGRFRRILRRAFRTLIWLVVIAAIGAGIYYAWPIVYDRYIRPVETNTTMSAALEERIALAEASITQLDARAGELESIADGLASTQAATSEQLTALDDLIALHTTRLDQLAAATADLAAADIESGATATVELGILRSMELMSRARLFLYQANYGLAAQDLQSARNLLAELDTTPADAVTVTEALFRLDLALGALPGRPVAASDDLDLAWQALLGELPPPTPTVPDTEPPATTVPSPSTTAP